MIHAPHFFALLTDKCASRHNDVHFFDISISKSGPNVVCFVHFDLEMCFMNMSFVLRLPRKMHLCRSSSNVPRLPSFLEMLQNPHVLLTFDTVHNPLRLPRETKSERPKVVRTPGVF